MRYKRDCAKSRSPYLPFSVRQKERPFGTTCLSIGKIAKMLWKIHSEILNRSAFHELSRQKSSTLLIYKSWRMRYNNLARRKQTFRRERYSSSRPLRNINLMMSSVQRRQTLYLPTSIIESLRGRYERDRFTADSVFLFYSARKSTSFSSFSHRFLVQFIKNSTCSA